MASSNAAASEGNHDTVIPVTHARNLAKSIPQARYVELPSGHNEWALSGLTRIAEN